MRTRRRRLLLLLLVGLLGAVAPGAGRDASAQGVPRDDYLRYLPTTPRIVTQTGASARLRLYGDAGDSAYRDADPVDGIDDARGERLLLLAERFSPLLRRNNTSVPRDLDRAFGGRFVLAADTWVDGRLARSDSVDLDAIGPDAFYAADGRGPAPGAGGDGERALAADAMLRALVDELQPLHPAPRFAAPGGETERVLFFDVPGSDEPSWRATLDKGRPRGAHVYAHFFVHEALPAEPFAETPEDAARRFHLVVQYWFYYPFNDGPNNHEGDWEHLNVSITTRERAASGGLLSEEDIAGMLGGAPEDVESLVIHLVEYYVHEYIVTLDYLALQSHPGARHTPHAQHATTHIWEDADFEQEVVRERLAIAGGRLATHPVAYAGGDSKGPDELLHPLPRFRLSYNRNSDATYPFPGVWAKVGPAQATEKVYGSAVPRVRRRADSLPWYALIDDDRMETFRRGDITLLPDWERLSPLVAADPAARRRWVWLVLPVRLGYPATRSPGAGIVKRADGGNISPLAPSFNPAWNRLGPSWKYEALDPLVLRASGAPVTPWAMLQNGWGALNYPVAAVGLLPGANVALTQLIPWATGALNLVGAPPLRTFTRGPLPLRITSEGQGVSYQFGGHDFARLLPGANEAAAALGADAADGREAGFHRTAHSGPRLWFNLFYGPRFSLENTFAWDTSSLSYTAVGGGGGGSRLGTVRGRLVLTELTGGFRFSAVNAWDQTLQLYLRGGYAWTRYSVRDVSVNGVPLPGRRGGHLPSLLPSRTWWPNTTYGGAGAELFAPKHWWLMHRLGYGVRAEVGGIRHRLDEKACPDCAVVTERGDAALSLVFGW